MVCQSEVLADIKETRDEKQNFFLIFFFQDEWPVSLLPRWWILEILHSERVERVRKYCVNARVAFARRGRKTCDVCVGGWIMAYDVDFLTECE